MPSIRDAPFKNLPQAPNVTVPAYVYDMPAVSDMKQYLRPVKLCDHVRVSGIYVLDNAHWMYSKNDCWNGQQVGLIIRGHKTNLNTCKPHAEFHPYLPDSKWNLIRFVEPPRWDLPTVEEHVIAVPFTPFTLTQLFSKTW
jgi:hypothetical protein